MREATGERHSTLLDVANAMVRLHKEHFGRGPTKARAHFAGPDMLLCALSDALLPAERRLTELGLQEQVRHSRASFQAAVQAEFVQEIEAITHRKVKAFASATDPDSNTVFEAFCFEPLAARNGATPSGAVDASDPPLPDRAQASGQEA